MPIHPVCDSIMLSSIILCQADDKQHGKINTIVNMNLYSIFYSIYSSNLLLNSSYTSMFFIDIYYNKITWINNEQYYIIN